MTSGTVVAHSRLHFGLADVGTATIRRYGGAGVVVARPATLVRWHAARAPLSVVGAPAELVADARRAVERLARALGRSLTGQAEVVETPEPHVGHGSKTSGVLAALKAVVLANSLDVPDAALITASGRGGTSGVGVHGFFGGGLIVDAGHPQDGRSIGPSSLSGPTGPPLLLYRVKWPSSWNIALVRPARATGTSGAREVDFFRRNSPIPDADAWAALAAIYHGVLPAVLTHDAAALGQALDRLAATGFKARELDAQPAAVRGLLAELRGAGAPAGMSSLGPLLFAVVPSADHALHQRVDYVARAAEAAVVWTHASTTGHVVRHKAADGT